MPLSKLYMLCINVCRHESVWLKVSSYIHNTYIRTYIHTYIHAYTYVCVPVQLIEVGLLASSLLLAVGQQAKFNHACFIVNRSRVYIIYNYILILSQSLLWHILSKLRNDQFSILHSSILGHANATYVYM